MADQTDTNVKKFDPIEGLRCVDLAKLAYRDLYQQLGFEITLAERGITLWDVEDPAFVKALEEFTHKFREYLKNNPEIDKELDQYAPRVAVERVVAEAKNLPDDKAILYAQKYVDLANVAAKKRRTEIINEEAARQAVLESLAKAAKEAKKSGAPENFSKNVLDAVAEHKEVQGQIDQEALNTVIKERQKEIADEPQLESTILQTSLGNPSPDIKARIMTRMSAEGADFLLADEASDRLALEAAALLFKAPEGSEGMNFFGGTAEGIQKGVAPILDILTEMAGPENRRAIEESILGNSLDRVINKPDPSLGEFVNSPTYSEVLRAGKEKLGRPAPLNENNFARRLVARVAMSSTVGRMAGHDPDRTIRDAILLAKYDVYNMAKPPAAPSAGPAREQPISAAIAIPVVTFLSVPKIYLATAVAKFPLDFHLDFSAVSGWLLNFGAQKIGEKAASGAVKAGATALTTKAVGGTVGGLIGGAIAGPPGVLVGRALSGLITSLPGKIAGFAANLVGLGGVVSHLFEDLPKALAIGAVGIIVLLFFLPVDFIPFNNRTNNFRDIALEVSGEKPVGGGTTPNLAVFSYPNIPTPLKSSAIIRSPVANITAANITQGPNQGNHVGIEANSYDIGVSNGTPVYSSNNGVIVDFADNFSEGQHVANSAGNFIRVEGVDTNGQTYFLTYEHLLGIAPNLARGTEVTTDTLLGYSDDTGNSTGPHLHYQCNGSVCANMLPGITQ